MKLIYKIYQRLLSFYSVRYASYMIAKSTFFLVVHSKTSINMLGNSMFDTNSKIKSKQLSDYSLIFLIISQMKRLRISQFFVLTNATSESQTRDGVN